MIQYMFIWMYVVIIYNRLRILENFGSTRPIFVGSTPTFLDFFGICIVVVYLGGPENVEKKVFFRVVSNLISRIYEK